MIVVALNILLWLIPGFFIMRYGFRVRDWVILAPTMAGAGTIAYFMLVFVLIRLFPAAASGWLASVILLILSAGLWYRYRDRVAPLQLGVSRRTAGILLALWMLCGLIFIGVVPKERHDEFDHYPRATMIAQVGQPLRFSSGSYIAPEKCQYYHYAESLFVGVMFDQSNNFNLPRLYDVRVIYNAWAATGLCFVFLWLLLKRQLVAWAIIGTFLFLTIGPPNWVALAHRIPEVEQHIPHTAFFDVFRDEANRVATPAEFIKDPERSKAFPRTDVVSFIWYLTSPNPSSFWVIGFLVLIGWYAMRHEPYAWYWYAGLGALTGLSAVYYTTGLLLIGPIIGFDLLWNVVKNRQSPRYTVQSLLAFTLTALVFLTFQGGTVTDALLCPLTMADNNDGNYEANWITFLEPLSYQNKEFSAAPVTAYLYKPADWNIFFMAWGIGLFLAPVMLVYSLLRQQQAFIVIMLSVMISLLLIFFILIENVGANMARIPTLSIWLIGGMSIFLLRALWRQKWYFLNKLLVIVIILLMSLSTVGNAIQFILRPEASTWIMDPIDYEVQQAWFNRLDIEDEAVFDPHSFSDDVTIRSIGVAKPIVIFGTYSHLNGHVANVVQVYGPEPWEPWEETCLPGYLTKVGYTHLYLDEKSFANLSDRCAMRVFNPDYYHLLETWFDPETKQLRQLFKILSDATTEVKPVSSDVLFATLAPSLYAQAPKQAADFTLYTPDGAKLSVLLSYLWSAEYRQGEQTAVDEIFKFQTLDEISLSLQTSEQKEALARWKTAFLPGDLNMAGLEQVWLTQESLSTLDPDIVENILRSPYYEITNRLVIGEDEAYEFTTTSDVSMATYSPSTREALDRWRTTFLPGDLNMAGIEQVWLSQEAINALDPYIVENILRVPYYEITNERMIGEVEMVQFTTTSDASMATYGLSSEDFAALQNYDRPIEFENDTRILNPTTRNLIYARFARYSIASASPIYRDEGEHDETLEVINVLSRLIDLQDADLRPDQGLALENWQTTRDPDDLRAAGFEYIIFDQFWLDTLPEDQRAMMLNEENYTPVPGWEFQFFDEQHRLYKVKQ